MIFFTFSVLFSFGLFIPLLFHLQYWWWWWWATLFNEGDIWQYFSYTDNLMALKPNPPCQLSLLEKTGVPGENPRLSAERWLYSFLHEDIKPGTLEAKGEWSDHYTAEILYCLLTINYLPSIFCEQKHTYVKWTLVLDLKVLKKDLQLMAMNLVHLTWFYCITATDFTHL